MNFTIDASRNRESAEMQNMHDKLDRMTNEALTQKHSHDKEIEILKQNSSSITKE